MGIVGIHVMSRLSGERLAKPTHCFPETRALGIILGGEQAGGAGIPPRLAVEPVELGVGWASLVFARHPLRGRGHLHGGRGSPSPKPHRELG